MQSHSFTKRAEVLAKELGVTDSVAMDILYLRSYEERIIKAAKAHPTIRDFEVFNEELECQLGKLETTETKH